MHCHVTMDQAKPFPRLSSILRVHLNKLIMRGKGDVKKTHYTGSDSRQGRCSKKRLAYAISGGLDSLIIVGWEAP